ncbi:MAG: hypothetical protein WD021_10470 [Rhodothermales bacterium]
MTTSSEPHPFAARVHRRGTSSAQPPSFTRRRPHFVRIRLVSVVSAAVIAMAVAACGRPFEEAARPRIDILSPDLSSVQVERQMQLSVRVTSSIQIERIVAGDDTLTYDEDGNAWNGEYVLSNGLNRIVLSITDADLQTTLDTVYALQDVLTAARSTPHLPESRGGHTTTMTDDGTLYIFGGAPHATAAAISTNLVWRDGASVIEALDQDLSAARIGHAAALLPDGRILITGGSRKEEVGIVDDLVESVEVFDPVSESFDVLPVEGEPIRRAYHTASLHEIDGEVFVDLYGGVGDDSYNPPILGIRSDVRRFRVDADRLVALDPAPGPRLNHRISGHSQIQLFPNIDTNRRDLITGTHYAEIVEQDVSFELEYAPNIGLLQHTVRFPNTPRERHAAVLLEDGFVGIFGGRQGSYDRAVSRTEIYAAAAKGYFHYADVNIPMSRYGHTATKVREKRILILGGFLPSGEGAVTTELFQIPDFNYGWTGADTP